MLLGEIERNKTEKIKVETREYKGKDFLSARIFYHADSGEWLPTKKGITIKPDQVKELIELLQKAPGEFKQLNEKKPDSQA